MKSLWTLAVLSVCGLSAAAQSLPAQAPAQIRRAFRIPVRSADPWFIKFALEGRPLVSPELSTLFSFFGAGGQAGNQAAGQVNSLLTGGRLLVNPTDNSLWWYPD
jgi:hypothetical protein